MSNSQISPLIMDSPSVCTKLANDMVLNEGEHVGGFDYNEQNSLYPFREVIGYHDNALVVFE